MEKSRDLGRNFLSLRSKSEVGSQKSEVFFNNLMVKTFYSLGRLNLRRETARFPTASRAEKLGSVTPLMKSEVPRYAAARLHRSQKSEVRIIHDEYNGYFRAVISELIVTSDFKLHTSDFKEAPATNLF
jgi:hypothetical protein